MFEPNVLKDALMKALGFILDTIAPPDPSVRNIENMSVSGFIDRAERATRSRHEGTISYFSYRGSMVKTAILEVKSRGNAKIASLLGKVTYELLLEDLSELAIFRNFRSPLLVPVPMTKRSKRRRGWNQCEMFAEEMARADKSGSFELRTDILFKIKETGDQVGKGREDRLRDLKGSFSVKSPEKVSGRDVIVLDDIRTTGATLAEAKRALKEAGARKVLLISIAR